LAISSKRNFLKFAIKIMLEAKAIFLNAIFRKYFRNAFFIIKTLIFGFQPTICTTV